MAASGEKKGFSVGVDAGGTKVAYGLFDESGALISRREFPTRQNLPPKDFMLDLARNVRELCEANGTSVGNTRADSIAGVGIGMPCFIRQPEGHIIKSSNIPALRDFPARDFLTKELGTRVELLNDTQAAALGEHTRGAGVGRKHMIYCSVSSGLAAVPVIDGKLFVGSYGFAGESGHMLATPGEGELCPCGKRGCYMSWCSGHMIVKHVARWISDADGGAADSAASDSVAGVNGGGDNARRGAVDIGDGGERSVMLDMAGGDASAITTKHIKAAWEAGDALAARAIAQMQRYQALWLYNHYLFTNIDCFILGGGLVKMGDVFWNETFRQFKEYDDCGCECSFLFASLGESVGIIGANEFLRYRLKELQRNNMDS